MIEVEFELKVKDFAYSVIATGGCWPDEHTGALTGDLTDIDIFDPDGNRIHPAEPILGLIEQSAMERIYSRFEEIMNEGRSSLRERKA